MHWNIFVLPFSPLQIFKIILKLYFAHVQRDPACLATPLWAYFTLFRTFYVLKVCGYMYNRFHEFASPRTICVMHKKCSEAMGVAVFDDSESIWRMYFALKPLIEEKNSHAYGLTSLFMFMYYANLWNRVYHRPSIFNRIKVEDFSCTENLFVPNSGESEWSYRLSKWVQGWIFHGGD